MKKIREERTEYYHDEETGRVLVKTEEKVLITEKNGEQVWNTTSRTVPII